MPHLMPSPIADNASDHREEQESVGTDDIPSLIRRLNTFLQSRQEPPPKVIGVNGTLDLSNCLATSWRDAEALGSNKQDCDPTLILENQSTIGSRRVHTRGDYLVSICWLIE